MKSDTIVNQVSIAPLASSSTSALAKILMPFADGLPSGLSGRAAMRIGTSCDCPERFAQEALGHNSKAMHRANAKRSLMKLPSLEDYEQRAAEKVETPA